MEGFFGNIFNVHITQILLRASCE